MQNIAGAKRDLPRKHLPELIDDAKRWLTGRKCSNMLRILNGSNFMAGWRIENRYWPDNAFTEDGCRNIRKDARRICGASGVLP